VVVLAILAVSGFAIYQSSQHGSREPLSSTSGAPTQDAAAQPALRCDLYEVTAETLAAREPNGELTGGYFGRGTKLTVQKRQGPAGNRYWYVTAADGRNG
jgi:hypothetical protein